MINNGKDIRKAMRDAKKEPSKGDPLKGVIYDPRGQYAFPGEITKIQGDAYGTPITMVGVPYPMLGVDDLGYSQMMYPNMEYQFAGQHVTEYPMPPKQYFNAYGGDPSLPAITGHYPFGGMYTKTHTHMQEGGWLDAYDDEYRRGGGVNPLMKSRSKRATTKKNIQSSINKLFLRNKDLFGPAGKNIYDPNSKYQEGGWLDQYQNAGTTGVRKPYILSDAELANAQPYQKLSKEEELAWLAMQPSQQPEHILRQTEKQGKGSKAWEVLMNPMTAATNLYQKGYLPDNFSQGPTNPLDIAFQMVNPLWRIDSAISAANAVKEGDYTSAAVDAAFTTPWGKVVKGAKTLKGLPKGKMEGPGTAKDLIKDKEAVKAIKNKIAQEKIDAYNAIQKLKTGRPKSSMGQNKFLSGERKISKQELDFTTKYPPTEGAGFYDYPTDPNYLYNFKTYSARPLEEIVTPYRKKLGGWLDNLD